MLAYCDAVTAFWLQTGVAVAVDALRGGFHDYIPLIALRLLTVEEIHGLVNGNTLPVPRQDFEENCLADHGYTLICKHVQWLFDILAGFDAAAQRKFFAFLIGSPHLPVGGLASLKPKMTIVRKTSSDAAVREEDQLPSAMTCQNYLKLPAYETKEQMRTKLLQAIYEGAEAFLLT
ncbi:unnamed protein product [Phytomonas sp. Hart1]|nr:unnamed protein product [Phytomonas sp. Hart1]|eukprot:CCW70605.1 unnamed protein product [Phytomonas sp. isolate Hart1]